MKYNVDTKTVELDVAELCFLSCGSKIQKTFSDKEAAETLVQNIDDYIKELSVTKSFVFAGKNIKMTGVADGFFEKKDGARVALVKAVPSKEFSKKPKDELYTYIKKIK